MKKKNIIKNVIIAFLIVICVGEGMLLKATVFTKQTGIANISKLRTIKKVIDDNYLDEVNDDDLVEYTYKGLMAGLNDPYSVYYTKEEYKQQQESSSGVFSGIGVSIQKDTNTGIISVVRAIKDGPAEGAGIQKGDVLYKIEGKEISTTDDLNNVVTKIKGKEGTKVNLTFLRNNKEINVTLTRKKIVNQTVEFEMLDRSVGYIRISDFEEVTPDQFASAVKMLNQRGMKKLVVDLRDNPGGLLQAVVKMVDMVLPKGKMITYTEDKNGNRREYKSTTDPTLNVPMAVLINGNSASASEIFAGAMQDYKRATLVGTTSFGKGIVQNIIGLSDGSAIKITIENYYTPNGRSIHKKGIKPDVKEELDKALQTKSEVKKSEDNQLKKAIATLNKK